MKYLSYLFFLALVCLLLFSCPQELSIEADSIDTIESGRPVQPVTDSSSISSNKTIIVRDTGVIKYINLEGGFYGILGEKDNYDPVNLPKEFTKDGLKVQFIAEVLRDVSSFHMWGTIIRITTMVTIESKEKWVMDSGVLNQVFIQGAPWIIDAVSDDYQPINLPPEYQVENLKVSFVGKIREDIVIIPALWPLIELTTIERISSDPINVKLGEDFKLPVGESALVKRQKILFTFKKVLQDSRCPIGVSCFWEGEAVILVNVKIGSINYGDYEMKTSDYPSIINVGWYSVQFKELAPYPVYNVPIDPNSYVGYFLIDYALES